jgi:hypothetical protein
MPLRLGVQLDGHHEVVAVQQILPVEHFYQGVMAVTLKQELCCNSKTKSRGRELTNGYGQAASCH